jgi:hypothetical protein
MFGARTAQKCSIGRFLAARGIKMLYRTAVVLDAHQLFNQYCSSLNIIKFIYIDVQL